MENPKEIKIEIACEGNCSETMEIKRIGWDDVDIDYYITFRTDMFYCGQSVIGIIKERIKFSWEALRKGNYIHQEIVTNKKSLIKLSDELNKMLS